MKKIGLVGGTGPESTLMYYKEINSRMDEIEVKVEAPADLFFDNLREMENVKTRIGKSIENETGIKVKVTLVKPKSITRFEGKAKRVIDKRNLH